MLRKATSKSIRLFDENYDDSSDEESVESASQYDIDKYWHELPAKLPAKKIIENDNLLSFVAHAAGISFLYSHEINAEYYPLKISKMTSTTSAAELLVRLLKKAVSGGLESTIESLNDYCLKSALIHKKNDSIVNKMQQHIPDILRECDKYIENNIEAIIDCVKKSNDMAQLDFLIKNICDIVINQWQRVINSEVTISGLKDSEEGVNWWATLHVQAKEALLLTLDKLKLSKMQNAIGKQEAQEKLATHNKDNGKLLKLFIDYLAKSPARGYIASIASHFFDDQAVKDDIVLAQLFDLYQMFIDTKLKSKLSPAKQKLTLSSYAGTRLNYQKIMTHYLTKYLRHHIQQELLSFTRPTLGRSSQLYSDNPMTFYANLRLANRSQKRNILNLKHAVIQGDTVARVWRLIKEASAETDVIDTQEILSNSLGRKDLVEGLGNYEKVFEIINDIKAIYNKSALLIDDKIIAGWLRDTLLGKKIQFKLSELNNQIVTHKLQAITYLIFGCECARNPAMIIANQMLLDLIIHCHDWTFEKAFSTSSPSMPMVAEGAVAAARALESRYRAKMPFHYRYAGHEDSVNVDALIHAEANIIRNWLRQVVKINLQDKIQAKPAGWLLGMIQDYYTQWFALPKERKLVKDDSIKELKK